MENLGKELVVSLGGTFARRHLAAIENGYFLLVSDYPDDKSSGRIRAIRLKCN